MMQISAVSCLPFDIEISCFGTLLRYVNAGANVNLVLVTAKGWTAKDRQSAVRRTTLSRMTVFEINNFDYEVMTQENVKQIESHLKDTNPSVVIIPFTSSTNSRRRMVGSSALVGSRSCPNVLMYELDRNNRNYAPNVYCPIDKRSVETKLSLIKEDSEQSKKVQRLRMLRALTRFHSNFVVASRIVEVFQSHRLVLNEDIF